MKPRQLDVEPLEDRCVPVTWGNPWPDATHLTLSFVSDGTMIGDRVSDLQNVLDAQAARQDWQREILRAFQTWAVNANINIGLVADGGQALGSAGRPQGDGRFGDIRIAGHALGSDVLALASPFESTAGTWSGDVKLNTTADWGIAGQGSVDVFSALLHEAGHVFGMDHNSDPSSPLFATYQGIRTGLAASDIANLQALYGSRTADRYEGTSGNDSLSTATRLSLITASDGSLGVAAEGDLRTINDKDFFRFQAPLNAGPMLIHLKTEGISLLNARVTVYDSSNRVVASSASTDPLNNDLTLRINSPRALSTYSVRIESATRDAFGVGSYRLEVKSLPLLSTVTSTLSTTVNTATRLLSDDLHTDDTILTATLLPPLATRVDSRFDYGFRGSIRDSWDVDFYRITAPQAVSGTQTVMSIMIWGTENEGLRPRVSVYDANHQAVEAEVLVNADGIFTAQVRNVRGGAAHYVKVEASETRGSHATGNYFLGIDFSSRAVALETLTAGTLSAADPSTGGLLTVGQSEMLHLVLSAEGAPARVRMTISDLRGQAITTVETMTGKDPSSLTQGLLAGRYLVRFEAFALDGSSLGEVRFRVKQARLSDPIGPRNEDTTTAPSGSPPPSSSQTTYSSPPPATTSAPSSYSYPPPSSSTETTSTPPPDSSSPGYTTTPSGSTSTTSSSPPPDSYQATYQSGMTDEEYYYYCWYSQYYSADSQSNPDAPASDPYTAS